MSRLSKFALGMFTVALAATTAQAQDPAATGGPASEGRLQVSAHLSQYFADEDFAEGGFGGRVMIAAPSGYTLGIFSRPSIGAYLTYTSENGGEVSGVDVDFDASTLNVGGELDLRFFNSPVINDRVDPFLSLGAGLFRTSVDVEGESASENSFAFTPGLGANFVLQQGMSISARGDLGYQIVTGENDNFSGLVAQLGLAFAF